MKRTLIYISFLLLGITSLCFSDTTRVLYSYDIAPDSNIAVRLGGYGIGESANEVEPSQHKIIFSFNILPDSNITCRLAGYGASASSHDPVIKQSRQVFSFNVEPDSNIIVRLAGYRINGVEEIEHPVTRWVFSYGLVGSLTVIVMTEPYGGEITVDGAPPVFCDTIRGLVADPHNIAVFDSIQRVLDDRYWFIFKQWVTSFGDTLYEPSLDIALPGENAIYKAYFDYSPTASSILKDHVWFDPYGRKRSFKHP